MKRRYLLTALTTLLAIAGNAQRVVCDETCKIEFQTPADEIALTSAAKSHSAEYAVVSPVGIGTMEMINQAPRLTTLNGKTIAVVGGSFMASITHPEIKRLILENYPDAKVILLDEIGSAGVYPAPGVTRRAKDEFQARLREMNVDAVISGNCGCGLCTPKETGSCIAAEYIGIPAVAIAAPSFVNEVYTTEINNGIPAPRVAEYPGAFTAHTAQQLRDNTRRVLWPAIVDALTRPITDDEIAANARRDGGDIRNDVYYGTLQEVNDHFVDMRWSDGLPIIPPTFEAVEEFLKFTDRSWDETVAVISPAHRNTTVWHVAVNGVMAGCKPEYMPILLAITEGMSKGDFRRTLASTHGWTPYCWLNGPVSRQLGLSDGCGEISDEANARIGRFINLALQNLMGMYVGENRMGTFGYLMPWCLTEDDAACLAVGWQPWHVQKGFDVNDNTVTVSSALSWGNNMAPSTTDPEKIMQLMAWDITERCQFALGSGKQFTNRTILITPPVATNLSKGYDSLDRLESELIATARRPLKERAFANYYANPGSNPEERHPMRNWQGHLRRTEQAEMTSTPQWYDTDAEEMLTIPTMEKGATAFIVTGDPSRNKIQTMPGGGNATIEIRLPRNWDALMAGLGYRPLSEYRL